MDTSQKNPTPAKLPETTIDRARIDSDNLFQGASVIEIEHAGQRYLLRVTRENKLILTK